MKSITTMNTLIAVVVGAPLVLPAAALAQPAAPAAVHAVVPAVPQPAQGRTVSRVAPPERQHGQQPEPPPRPGALARTRQHAIERTQTVTRTFKVGARGELVLSNLSGHITIMRGGGNELKVEAVKTARGRDEQDAQEMLDLVQVEFVERGSRAEAKSVYPHDRGARTERRNINVSVTYTVTAPEHTRITARTLSGNIRVNDIKGELALTSTSGNVIISNAARVLNARSTSGNVEITNMTSEAGCDAGSISGNVVLRQVRAPRLEAGTISGRVLLHDVVADRLTAQSVSGDVEFASALSKSGRYTLKSHSGNVRLALAGDTGFELDASSFAGAVRSEIPLKDQVVVASDVRRRVGEGGRARAVRGVFGDGSALLDVTSFSGNVTVTRR